MCEASNVILFNAVSTSLPATLVESLDRSSLSHEERHSCLNALKMTAYLLCNMCDRYESLVAKPPTVVAATKVQMSVLIFYGNYTSFEIILLPV